MNHYNTQSFDEEVLNNKFFKSLIDKLLDEDENKEQKPKDENQKKNIEVFPGFTIETEVIAKPEEKKCVKEKDVKENSENKLKSDEFKHRNIFYDKPLFGQTYSDKSSFDKPSFKSSFDDPLFEKPSVNKPFFGKPFFEQTTDMSGKMFKSKPEGKLEGKPECEQKKKQNKELNDKQMNKTVWSQVFNKPLDVNNEVQHKEVQYNEVQNKEVQNKENEPKLIIDLTNNKIEDQSDNIIYTINDITLKQKEYRALVIPEFTVKDTSVFIKKFNLFRTPCKITKLNNLMALVSVGSKKFILRLFDDFTKIQHYWSYEYIKTVDENETQQKLSDTLKTEICVVAQPYYICEIKYELEALELCRNYIIKEIDYDFITSLPKPDIDLISKEYIRIDDDYLVESALKRDFIPVNFKINDKK